MAATDVDAALNQMRALLGTDQPTNWPTREFGSPVPAVQTWTGVVSDRAHQASNNLNQQRQGLADAHADVAALVTRAGQVATNARNRLDAIRAQWQADKQSLAPVAATPAGKAALLHLGQLRISEGAATVQGAQAKYSELAGEVQTITGRLPKPDPQRGGVQLVDFKQAPPDDPTNPPEPGGGYGSYHYGYQFSTREGWTKEQIMSEVQKHFNNYFTFTADGEIVEGAKLNLKGPFGENEPVQVTSVTPDSFSFISLPGHNEGTGRVIKFSIVPSAENPIPGRLNWELRVAASGPLSKGSLVPGASWGNKGIWQIFADNLNSRLPSLPTQSGLATA